MSDFAANSKQPCYQGGLFLKPLDNTIIVFTALISRSTVLIRNLLINFSNPPFCQFVFYKLFDVRSAFCGHKEFKAAVAAFLEMLIANCKIIACTFCTASVVDQLAA